MKMMRILIAALLAVTLVAATGSTIMAPNFNMFSAPDLSLKNLGFGQIQPSQLSTTPILMAPSSLELMYGSKLSGGHIKPKLMTNNWAPSMKTSTINQMFSMMALGIGSKNVP